MIVIPVGLIVAMAIIFMLIPEEGETYCGNLWAWIKLLSGLAAFIAVAAGFTWFLLGQYIN